MSPDCKIKRRYSPVAGDDLYHYLLGLANDTVYMSSETEARMFGLEPRLRSQPSVALKSEALSGGISGVRCQTESILGSLARCDLPTPAV
jgi:hypothetical protein